MAMAKRLAAIAGLLTEQPSARSEVDGAAMLALQANVLSVVHAVAVTTSGIVNSGIVNSGTSTIVCSTASPGASTSGPVVEALPSPGPQRRASLTNPPTPIPPRVLALYQQAAATSGLPWPLLAGIGMEETNHGRNNTTLECSRKSGGDDLGREFVDVSIS